MRQGSPPLIAPPDRMLCADAMRTLSFTLCLFRQVSTIASSAQSWLERTFAYVCSYAIPVQSLHVRYQPHRHKVNRRNKGRKIIIENECMRKIPRIASTKRNIAWAGCRCFPSCFSSSTRRHGFSASLLQTLGRAMPTPKLAGSVPPVPLYYSSLDLLGGPGACLTVPPARRIVGTWLKNLQNLLGTLLRHSARKRSRVAQSVWYIPSATMMLLQRLR